MKMGRVFLSLKTPKQTGMKFHVPAEPRVTKQTSYRNGPETGASTPSDAGAHSVPHLLPPAALWSIPAPGWYPMGAHRYLAQV